MLKSFQSLFNRGPQEDLQKGSQSRLDFTAFSATQRQSFIGVLFLVGVFCFSRLIPHPPNFTALGAVLVWATAFSGSRALALLGLWVGLLLTDVVFGFYSQMIWVYLTLAALMGLSFFLKPLSSPIKFVSFTALQSFAFFVTTNFAVWATSPFYTKDFAGLLQCYTLAVPFYGNQVLGDLVYIPTVGLALGFAVLLIKRAESQPAPRSFIG